jgi:energy-coupling factor transport system permease protein
VRTALSYRPRHGPIQDASPWAAIAFLGSFGLVALLCSNPIVLLGAGAAVVVAGLAAGAGGALAVAARFGLTLGIAIVVVNVLVTTRGETILIRGWELPILGETAITLESIAAGGVLALRILVIVAASAVYSSCVDPDRVLRLVRPLARRSALTASLIARLVPLAASDLARLREAGKLRGPAAAPATRAAIARRLLTGALDRAVDSAATLELRGYATAGRPRPARRPRTRQDRWFALAALCVAAAAIAVTVSGGAGFDPYPAISVDIEPATLALAAALPALAALPFALSRRARARRRAFAPAPRTKASHA